MSGAVNEPAVSTGMPLAGEKATSISLLFHAPPSFYCCPTMPCCSNVSHCRAEMSAALNMQGHGSKRSGDRGRDYHKPNRSCSGFVFLPAGSISAPT